MRLLVVLALLTALGACDVAGERDALADSRPPPGIAPRFLPPDGWAWGVAQPDAMPQVRVGCFEGVILSRRPPGAAREHGAGAPSPPTVQASTTKKNRPPCTASMIAACMPPASSGARRR